MRWLVIAFVVLGGIAFPGPASRASPDPLPAPRPSIDRRVDEHSFAEPDRVRVKDLALDLTVDFATKQLAGTATLELDWREPGRSLVLDTRDLKISKIEGLVDGAWKRLRFTLGKRDAILGSALAIDADGAAKVRITYRTNALASGLQWLPPALTAAGKRPFMFTQSQAIHGRSWVPLQDTPAVRFTYSARIRTPKDLVALMSADNDPNVVRDGDYSFRMPQAIPSYLLALAVGDLVFKPLSERAGVWTEPNVADKAAAELADTEKMIQTTEALYGPYRWGRYDLLILPPSFPFGGMENPRLSFIHPSILAGDKSLISLVAHELAHSWSGNLVTNASWKDIWLNEGFTTYVENRVVEAIYGKELGDIEQAMMQTGLRGAIKSSPRTQQRLRIPPSPGADPDSLSDVAYTKGQWFLLTLEHRFGRALFDPFLKSWFDRHAFQSVTTEDFVVFLRAELLPKKPTAISDAELAEWLDGEGIPDSAVTVTSKRLAAIDAARKSWLDGGSFANLGADKWWVYEKLYFLDHLPQTLAKDKLVDLDRGLALTGTTNAELAQRWYPLAIRSSYAEARPAVVKFLETVGRRKLIVPIYKALVATPEGLALAERTFVKARANYHPVTIDTVRAIIAAAKKKKK